MSFMALSMPNRRFSKVIIRKGWPECPPSLIGDLAAAGRAEHENAQAAAGSVRRAIAEVESEEKGIFAAASVHAYKQELGLWNELAEGCAKESPMLFKRARFNRHCGSKSCVSTRKHTPRSKQPKRSSRETRWRWARRSRG
ncbi:hypothetical protein MAUC95_26430 [Mycobacteroides abscessus]|nr:hypothetical protein MAUC95_26430 [Mycobacteroides abscessus]